MRGLFALPSNPAGAFFVVLCWWPIAAMIALFYWLYIGWWWRASHSTYRRR